MKKHLIRNLIKGLSFTSAVFVFQACYGTPQDFGMDLLVEGEVTSRNTGDGIPQIKVSMNNGEYYEYTDEDGRFMFYAEPTDSLKFTFEDFDSSNNTKYLTKDTLVINEGERVYLDIVLDEE
jgi:hypothetical protein